jgi:hypothetical protein
MPPEIISSARWVSPRMRRRRVSLLARIEVDRPTVGGNRPVPASRRTPRHAAQKKYARTAMTYSVPQPSRWRISFIRVVSGHDYPGGKGCYFASQQNVECFVSDTSKLKANIETDPVQTVPRS